MNKKILSVIITFSIVVFFTSCKSDPKTQTVENTDTLSTNTDSSVIKNNKYLIEPPNSDYSGDYTDRYPNGIIKFSGFFRFGKRHGQWMAFYENGLKWSECFYDNGKKHGSSTVYFPNGKLQYSGWFKNDLRDSLWLFYDEKTGKEVDRRAFKNDQETGLVN